MVALSWANDCEATSRTTGVRRPRSVVTATATSIVSKRRSASSVQMTLAWGTRWKAVPIALTRRSLTETRTSWVELISSRSSSRRPTRRSAER